MCIRDSLTAKANGREPSKKDSEIEGRRLEAEADLKRSKADIEALEAALNGEKPRKAVGVVPRDW